jgi:uncharacterized DUF497 family protein
MRIEGLLWLPDIIEKLATKHGVSEEEVEEVLLGDPRFRFVERGHRSGEDIYAGMGQTDAGRYLVVFFILKQGGLALIISGRDMDAKERKLYERKRR